MTNKPYLHSSPAHSRAPTQQRYATIELECLAVHFAVDKCSFYLKARLPLNAECCVGPASCAFGNATSSLRCAHWSAASVLAIARRQRCRYPIRHVCLGPTQDTRGRIPESLYHSTHPSPFFPDPYHRHRTRLGPCG